MPHAYAGTPSFLRIVLEKAAELGLVAAELRKALVSGEAFPPSLRDWLRERGIEGYQATPRPTSAWSRTRPRRAKAWWSTKA